MDDSTKITFFSDTNKNRNKINNWICNYQRKRTASFKKETILIINQADYKPV